MVPEGEERSGKFDDLFEGCDRSIMHVGSTPRDIAQCRRFECVPQLLRRRKKPTASNWSTHTPAVAVREPTRRAAGAHLVPPSPSGVSRPAGR